MDSGELEAEVLSFIFENIDTVPHLEALLLIWQSGSNEWSPDQLASRIYVSPQRAKSILDDLRKRGFVASSSEEKAVYKFATEWDAQGRFMPRLADAYRTNLVRITTMIHSKGSASVREFARAFQIKKDT
jgi:predicted ArsR family transcriptional regulator